MRVGQPRFQKAVDDGRRRRLADRIQKNLIARMIVRIAHADQADAVLVALLFDLRQPHLAARILRQVPDQMAEMR